MFISLRHSSAAARALLFATALSAAGPALADHSGPAGVGGSGSLNIVGPDTLPAGGASAGFRLSYARPVQRADHELETLAGRHIHAHQTD
jgi:hypothetical protein